MQNFISNPLFYNTRRLWSACLIISFYFINWNALWSQKNIIHGLDKQTDTISVTSGDKYYDSGGPGGSKLPDQPGNYINCSDPFNESFNCTSIYTLCSNADTVSVNFVAYQIVTGDRLRVFSGSRPAGSILFNSQNQGVSLNGMKLTTGTFIKSRAEDGCLTFEWFCTTIGNSIGWEADVIISNKNLPSDTLCFPVCKPNVMISVPLDTCYKEIKIEDVLDNSPLFCNYDLILFYPFGTDRLDRDAVNRSHIDATFLYEIKENTSGATCFGYLQILEHLPPFAFCSSDTIFCLSWEQNIQDNLEAHTCSGLTYGYKSITFIALPCDAVISGMIIREIVINSDSNNTCTDTLFLKKSNIDSLICPSDLKVSCDLIFAAGSPAALTPQFLENLLDKNHDNFSDDDPSVVLFPQWQGFTLKDTSNYCGFSLSYNDFILPGCGNTFKIRRQWIVQLNCMDLDTICIQNIAVEDQKSPVFPAISNMELQVNPSDCKAVLSLDTLSGVADCNSVIQRIEIAYRDPDDPNKQILINNFLPVKLSLPPGGYTAKFVLVDQCFNASRREVCIQIMENEFPKAAAKTDLNFYMDPQVCWTRIYATDLDSLSKDQCCTKLHFAIAPLDSVRHYRQVWNSYFTNECIGQDQYANKKSTYDQWIDQWITAFVFKDYLDLTACNNHQILFRVFEACHLPPMDPGFQCGQHQWFCYLTMPAFRAWSNTNLGIPMCTSRYELDCFSILTSGLYSKDASYIYSGTQYLQDTTSCASVYTMEYLSRLPLQFDEIELQLEILDTASPKITALPDIILYADGSMWNENTIDSCCPDSGCTMDFVNHRLWPGNFTCNCDTAHFDKYYGGPLRTDAIYNQEGNYSYPHCHFYDTVSVPKPKYCIEPLFLDTIYANPINPDSIFYQPVFNKESGIKQFSIIGKCTDGFQISFEDSSTMSECNQGSLFRKWSLINACGILIHAQQKIIIKSRSDFEVIFPSDIEMECSVSSQFDPSSLPFPQIKDAEIESIDIRYTDTWIQDTSSTCSIMVRKWEITDQCVFNNNLTIQSDFILNDSLVADYSNRYCVYRALKDNGDGYIPYYQYIRFIDATPPIVKIADTVVFTTNNCQTLPFSFRPDLSDNCSPVNEIKLEAYLDLNHDQVIDQKLNAETEISIPGGLEPGTHHVMVIGKDLCGNMDTNINVILIKDGSSPLAYCTGSNTQVNIPISGQVNIFAKDFDAGSVAGCFSGPLSFSFSSDPNDSFRILNCDSTGLRNYTIWLTNLNQKQSTCPISVQVNGIQNVCHPQNEFLIGGAITSAQKNGINNVSVNINPLNINVLTDNSGFYQSPLLKAGQDLVLRPSKKDDPLNGVSTIDLLVMEKHILGQTLLMDPYLLIAADINQSGTITVSDLIELRRLILGNITSFSKNDNWNFVPGNFKFSDSTNPWVYPRTIEVKNQLHSISDANFIGIKTGDVNYSAVLGFNELETRGQEENIKFKVETQSINQTQQIKIFLESYTPNIKALQLGVFFSHKVISVKPVGGQLSLGSGEYNFLNGNVLKISWVDSKGRDFNPNDPLLILEMIGGASPIQTTLLDPLLFNSFLVSTSLEYKIKWHTYSGQSSNIKIFPNPSNEVVNIDFFLADTKQNNTHIQTINGKKIYIKNQAFRPGWNRILLNKSALGGPGTYIFVNNSCGKFEKLTFILF